MSSFGVWPGEGHPQGVPLPIVFSRRFALRRAPTRGAPTDWLLSTLCPGKGTHKGCPYPIVSLSEKGTAFVFSRRNALRRAPTRGAPTNCLLSAFGPGKGTHKGSSRGPWEGHPDCLLSALRRACPYQLPSAYCPGKGTHKGRPYRLSSLDFKGCPYRSSLGVMPWEGHPQGVPLPIVFSRRYALGRAPTRGDCLPLARITDCLLSALCPGKGTHKGCPYRLSSLGVWPWEGHPQGVLLPIVFSRRLALGRAPTRGAPTDCLLSAFGPGKGTHKGRPYPIQAALRGFVPI